METLTQVPEIVVEQATNDQDLGAVPESDQFRSNSVQIWDKSFTPQKELAEKYRGEGGPVDSTSTSPLSADDRRTRIDDLAAAALASIQVHAARIGNK